MNNSLKRISSDSVLVMNEQIYIRLQICRKINTHLFLRRQCFFHGTKNMYIKNCTLKSLRWSWIPAPSLSLHRQALPAVQREERLRGREMLTTAALNQLAQACRLYLLLTEKKDGKTTSYNGLGWRGNVDDCKKAWVYSNVLRLSFLLITYTKYSTCGFWPSV
jgi:hypothetical protein